MKRSCPLIILISLSLATLSYGGKMQDLTRGRLGRTPSSTVPIEISVKSETERTPLSLGAEKSQGPVVIADFGALEIEEIH